MISSPQRDFFGVEWSKLNRSKVITLRHSQGEATAAPWGLERCVPRMTYVEHAVVTLTLPLMPTQPVQPPIDCEAPPFFGVSGQSTMAPQLKMHHRCKAVP